MRGFSPCYRQKFAAWAHHCQVVVGKLTLNIINVHVKRQSKLDGLTISGHDICMDDRL